LIQIDKDPTNHWQGTRFGELRSTETAWLFAIFLFILIPFFTPAEFK